MKYRVVKENTYWALTMEVNNYIKEGWEPQGGISIERYGEISAYYFQAMIKREQQIDRSSESESENEEILESE